MYLLKKIFLLTPILFVACQSIPQAEDNKIVENEATQTITTSEITRVQWDSHGKFEQKIGELTPTGEWSYLELYYPPQYQTKSAIGLLNKNEKGEVLSFSFNCIEPNGKPSFLIEESKGLDRLNKSDQVEIDILLDGKRYGNPFKGNKAQLENFKKALMHAKIILFEAKTYGAPFKFRNKNSKILLNPVSCNDE